MLPAVALQPGVKDQFLLCYITQIYNCKAQRGKNVKYSYKVIKYRVFFLLFKKIMFKSHLMK
jgi:hypothetical protein